VPDILEIPSVEGPEPFPSEETHGRSLAQHVGRHGAAAASDFWVGAVDDVLIVAVTDLSGTILYANQKFCDISGYSQQELVGANHRLLNSGMHDTMFFQNMFRTIRRGNTWRGEICNRNKFGKLYWVATTIIPHRDADGAITRYVAFRFDITNQKNAQVKLAHAAHTDSLTGLLNRAGFQQLLEEKIEDCRATSTSFAVAILDIDNFKDINDVYGHETGDVLLRTVSERIRTAIRPTDVLARFGGDEFTLILSPSAEEAELKSLMDRVRQSIRAPLDLSVAKATVDASIGISLFPRHGSDASELVKKADMALYNAKRLGRARSDFFSDALGLTTTERMRVQDEARTGLEQRQFALHYQPIMSLHTGELESAEALLRWHHPELGLLAPGRFAQAFDDHRLSAAIGLYVRRTAVSQAAKWRADGIAFGKIAINTTAADFALPGYTDHLLAELRQHGLGPDVIAIEVTEGMFLGKEAGRIRDELDCLHAAGFEIAFDDFGTGFASLTHLKELPLDRIKIDRSFIINMVDDPSDRKIVECIINLAHGLGLVVTAEGIEDKAQMELLRGMGCDRIQGYLVSRPLASDAIEAMFMSPPTLAEL
jgi:diguanylate cyclase (GGDEF)-like protein/PAS domain S-box-containing protein